MYRVISVLVLSLFIQVSFSQSNDALYNMLRESFSGEEAYRTVSYVEKRWRLPGNSGFDESIFFVEDILRIPVANLQQ